MPPKKGNQPQRRKSKPGKKGPPRRRGVVPENASLLYKHLRMVLDPCQAPLTETAYAGPEGMVQRFVTTGQLSSLVNAAGYLVFIPGAFKTSGGTRVDGGTAGTVTYGVGDVPGYAFLNTNSRGARPIGACLRLHWNETELNRSGSIACGVLPASSLPDGASATIDQIYGLLPEKGRVPAGECEIVWNPSEEDVSYDGVIPTIGSTFEDKNALCFAYQGKPGFAIGWTYTLIYEWTPKTGLGMVGHSTVHKSIPDAVSQINNSLQAMGFKNKPLKAIANAVYNTVASYTPAGGALKLTKALAGAVHTLIP